MPPRRSRRPKRPSTHALEAIASTPTRRTRQSAAGAIQASESVGSGANQSSVSMGSGANQSSVSMGSGANQSSVSMGSGANPSSVNMGSGANQSSVSMGSGANPSSVSVGSGAISEELISSIVTRVTAAVTRQLTSPSLPNPVPPAEESQPLSSQSNIEVPVVQALAGEQGPQRPREVFTSVSMAVDACVPDKIKTKILQEEYIELGTLLVTPSYNDKYHLTLQPAKEGSTQSFALEPATRPKRITSIDMWLHAFHVFVGVYTGRYPQEAQGLMKYGSTIQDFADRGHNWRFYDENFRFLRQSQATSLPWGTIHWELWFKSQYPPKKVPILNGSTKPASVVFVPRSYCFKFHRGEECSGCSFKHTCFKCGALHKAVHCNFRSFSKKAVAPSNNQGFPNPNSSQNPRQSNSGGPANTRKNQ